MDLLERLGDDLARKALALELASGNDRVGEEVGRTIGQLSTTLQEAFTTALRVRRAAARGNEVLLELTNKARAEGSLKAEEDDGADRWENL